MLYFFASILQKNFGRVIMFKNVMNSEEKKWV